MPTKVQALDYPEKPDSPPVVPRTLRLLSCRRHDPLSRRRGKLIPETSTHRTDADLFSEVQRVFQGRYDLEQLVAVSDIRMLFLARDCILKRRVSLRINKGTGRRRTWFERETELLASLDHPSIRPVYMAGYEGAWAYRVTKWIEGESLASAVEQRGARSIPAVIQLTRDLLSVLEYAHSQQVVLRRIVPGNVMLDRAGRAVITDLRFANRIIDLADPDPDPSADAFLAPETWHGHAGETASDIYAAGALLYFAVTGHAPATDPAEIRPPCEVREACPQALQRLILRALRPDPRERYPTAADMAEDLMSELGEFETPTGAPEISHPSDHPEAWEKRLRRALGDQYELLDELGRGAFGSVYRVRDLRLEREVALKVLHPFLTAEPAVIERFRRESQLAAQLRHPNIVDVYDIGSRAGLLWYTMAYVAGVNFATLVNRRGPLPFMRVMIMMGEALDALAHAHAQGVVHRDLKPENILIDAARGRTQITDFGLAMALQGHYGDSSSHSGTPEFASPEQLLGEPVDHRTDLYSLSLVAFFGLTGKPPFGGATIEAIVAQHAAGRLPPLSTVRSDVPPGVLNVLTRGAARLPRDRFESAAAYEQALRESMMGWRMKPSAWFRRLLSGGLRRRPLRT